MVSRVSSCATRFSPTIASPKLVILLIIIELGVVDFVEVSADQLDNKRAAAATYLGKHPAFRRVVLPDA